MAIPECSSLALAQPRRSSIVCSEVALDINIQCPQCRSDQFIRTANPRRDEVVTCVDCGGHHKYGELEDHAVALAKELLAKAFPGMRWE